MVHGAASRQLSGRPGDQSKPPPCRFRPRSRGVVASPRQFGTGSEPTHDRRSLNLHDAAWQSRMKRSTATAVYCDLRQA